MDGFRIISALLEGCVLGILFFAGLWWTVKRGLSVSQPAVLFLGSLLLRTLLAAAGFFFISRGDWRNLVAGVAGFVLARIVITRIVTASEEMEPIVVRRRTR